MDTKGEQHEVHSGLHTLSFSLGGSKSEHPQATGLQSSPATAIKTDSVLWTSLTKSERTYVTLKKKRLEICIQAWKNTFSEVGGSKPSGHRAPRQVLRRCISGQSRRQKLALGHAAGCLLAAAHRQAALPRPPLLALPARPPD